MAAMLAPVPPPGARRTKISATIGFASQAPEVISKLVAAGTDIFRLNCAYRQPGVFEQCLRDIRAAASASGRKVEVTADLQGPKFCISEVFWTGVQLEEGQSVTLAVATAAADICRPSATGIRITVKETVEHTALLAALEVGTVVFIEEGKRQLKVTKRTSPSEVVAMVLVGGRLSPSTALEAPGLEIDCPALTEKDKEDVRFLIGLEPPVDYIAMSFVQKGSDIQDLLDFLDSLGVPASKRPKICPRIERPRAIKNLDSILEKSDGLIVARGELGFELGLEGVPFAQKLVIHKAKSRGLFPVMVSTQLMESMIKNAVPTRAEVSDVANAVFDGSDVIMLSGETAKGNYPVESVLAAAACARTADAQRKFIAPGFGVLPGFDKVDIALPPGSDGSGGEAAAEEETEAALPMGACKGKVIVMMGPPASGKGTQCKRLEAAYGLVHLSVGDIVRDEIKQGTELGAKVNVYMSRGDMVSDELTLSIVRDRLRQEDVMERGCLLDGFPRTGAQAEGLARSIQVDRFILLQVPDDVVISRALGRLNDPVTGQIYHLQHAPPPQEVVSRLERRKNDISEEIVRNRLKVFHAELASIVPHFQDRLILLDGTKSMNEVTALVRQSLVQEIHIAT
eukprot:TRINITY_DN41728_c0_g1_i1.p1 TRINITY_DN41728_c0_g1~~TRINITY_DN41728_c0_g1_i1.p1  ORF type:complete len:711 (+),score=147.84 TRINITY_DN41728_c0_g1_i1:257-2134(+)